MEQLLREQAAAEQKAQQEARLQAERAAADQNRQAIDQSRVQAQGQQANPAIAANALAFAEQNPIVSIVRRYPAALAAEQLRRKTAAASGDYRIV